MATAMLVIYGLRFAEQTTPGLLDAMEGLQDEHGKNLLGWCLIYGIIRAGFSVKLFL